MFNAIHLNDYNKPTLIKSVFSNNYEEYEIREDKNKNLSLKQYIHMFTAELFELINEKKNSTQNEQKVQLTIAVKFVNTTDIGILRIF